MTGARILVVDDEPQIRRALTRTLEANGFAVRAVGTGEEALTSLRWRPEAILLDLMLPDLDGLEVARRIREQATTPILVLSARGEESQKVVTCSGEEVHLTPTEYEVLKHLAQNAGKVITHRMLLQHAWGPEHVEETQYLHVLISQLRRKIESQPARPQYILTEPGVGYRFRSPA